MAYFLLNLCQQLGTLGNSSTDFVFKMSRDDIASYLGLRLETICRYIAHFTKSCIGRNSWPQRKVLSIEGLRYLVACDSGNS
ncbi:MAG: helix-turn-helix domain-containing protein [Pseudomonas sp.]